MGACWCSSNFVYGMYTFTQPYAAYWIDYLGRWVVEKLHGAGIPVMNMCGHPHHVQKAIDVGSFEIRCVLMQFMYCVVLWQYSGLPVS